MAKAITVWEDSRGNYHPSEAAADQTDIIEKFIRAFCMTPYAFGTEPTRRLLKTAWENGWIFIAPEGDEAYKNIPEKAPINYDNYKISAETHPHPPIVPYSRIINQF